MSSAVIIKALRTLRPDVLHVHDPELLTLFPVARWLVPHLVYDMHEYVPEAIAGKPYLPEKVRPAASRTTAVAQRSLAALGSGVVVVTEDQLAALGGRPQLRLVSPNYPRVQRFEGAVPLRELAADPRLKLVYVGSLSRARGCTSRRLWARMSKSLEKSLREETVAQLAGLVKKRTPAKKKAPRRRSSPKRAVKRPAKTRAKARARTKGSAKMRVVKRTTAARRKVVRATRRLKRSA